MSRLTVQKTYKLFIGGKFPRSESGRVRPVAGADGRPAAYASHASRKDLRDAVEAARGAQEPWQRTTATLRGQILYRMAEMLEAKRAELVELLSLPGAESPLAPEAEVSASVDRLVAFAGWADKYAQVLGGCNPVAGPHLNFTVPEPVGVVAVLAPDTPPLLGLVALAAPALCAGNTVVAAVSARAPLAGLVLGEVAATGDLPAGVLNLLASAPGELAPVMAGHRDIDAVHAADADPATEAVLRGGAAENLKRVTVRRGVAWADAAEGAHPWWIEPLVEMKTVWHPSGV